MTIIWIGSEIECLSDPHAKAEDIEYDNFTWVGGETPRARLVRCCFEALAKGAMGWRERPADYARFINCGLHPAGYVGSVGMSSIASWKTSCALFVRAALHWSGRTASVARCGSGIFAYLGGVSYASRAWCPWPLHITPLPGDVFYVASTPSSNDGHVGVFLEQPNGMIPDRWVTAEGGGGDGTRCVLSSRQIGKKFDPYGRTLQGWFDAGRMLPQS